MSLRITITGHRFWKNEENEKENLFSSLKILMNYISTPVTFIHGCAYGVDTWFGTFARLHNINFHMYFPFTRIIQIARSKYDLAFFGELNKQYDVAEKTVYVSRKFFTYGYQKRNMVMVDNVDLLLTYYTRNRSGSGNCYRYALSKGVPTLNLRLNDRDLRTVISQLTVLKNCEEV